MATGFLGAIGKFAKGAADMAQPFVMEEQRAAILAKRDEVLQGYDKEKQQSQEAFTAVQNQLTRDQTERHNSQDMALKAGELAIQQQNADKQGKVADATIQQAAAAVTKIKQEVELGNFTVAQQQRLSDVGDQIAKAATPEAFNAALEKYNALLGKEKLDGFEPITAFGAENESGVQEKNTGVLNKRTGKVEWQSVPKPGGSTTAPAAGERTIKGANGRTFAQSEVDDAVSKVMAEPTAENIAGFRQHFGSALADEHFKQIQDNAPAASAPPAAADTQTDPLSGFNLGEQESPGMKMLKGVGGSISKAREEKIAPVEKQAAQQAAQTVKSLIATKNLGDMRRLRATGELDKALSSGLLSAEESAIINAWLAKQK